MHDHSIERTENIQEEDITGYQGPYHTFSNFVRKHNKISNSKGTFRVPAVGKAVFHFLYV